MLFRSFCLCFYDISLWRLYKLRTVYRFHSCYIKCAKLFFNYSRRSSVTGILVDTGIPSFDTVVLNARHSFGLKWFTSDNVLLRQLFKLHVPYYYM